MRLKYWGSVMAGAILGGALIYGSAWVGAFYKELYFPAERRLIIPPGVSRSNNGEVGESREDRESRERRDVRPMPSTQPVYERICFEDEGPYGVGAGNACLNCHSVSGIERHVEEKPDRKFDHP